MKKSVITIIALATILSGCAVERFGRLTKVSKTEEKLFTCKEIEIELAKAEEFLSNVKIERGKIKATHVLGFLGDFGIGNTIEGDAAEASAEERIKGLKDLKVEKNCR